MYYSILTKRFYTNEEYASLDKEFYAHHEILEYVDNGVNEERADATVKGEIFNFDGVAHQGYMTPLEFTHEKNKIKVSIRNFYRAKIDAVVKEDVQKMAFGDIASLPQATIDKRTELKAEHSNKVTAIDACVTFMELDSLR